MKKALIFLILLFSCTSILVSQVQRTYSHKENHWQDWRKLSSGTPENIGQDMYAYHFVGGTGSAEVRTILYWNWDYSTIPTEAQVQSVTIKFKAYKGYQRDFHFSIHNIAHTISETSFNFFNDCITGNRIYENTMSPDQNKNVLFDMTSTSQSPAGNGQEIWNAVNNAVHSGNYYLTLGIKELVNLLSPPWQIYPYNSTNGVSSVPSVDLIINFTVIDPTVTLDQRLSTGSRVGKLRKWETTAFGDSIAPGTSFTFRLGSTQTVLGNQTVYSNQKYNNWNGLPDVTNHHSFIITSTTTSLTSNLVSTNAGVTIRNLLDGNAISNETIDFQDPWFIDYPDPNYANNIRNRGMKTTGNDALTFRSRTSPFYPNFTTAFENGQKYNGVFLNENPNFLPELPIYSVRAALTKDNVPLSQTGKTHKLYFQNWNTTGATTQQIVNNPSGYDQKAVVFSSASAVVNANYKATQLSSIPTAFSNNSQRKVVRTNDGWLHMVYESIGRVWLEHSSNNGSTWFIGNGGQPLDNGAGKCPSIDWLHTSSNTDFIVVAFQQQSGTSYDILGKIFERGTNGYQYRTGFNLGTVGTTESYSYNANPNITWGGNSNSTGVGYFTLTVEKKTGTPGIYFLYGELGISGIMTSSQPTYLTGTDASSTITSVNINKMYTTTAFHIIYQQDYSSGAKSIFQKFITCSRNGSSWSCSNTYTANLSSTTGVQNYKPSMVEMPNGDVRVCWIRCLNGDPVNSPFSVNGVYWNSAVTPAQYYIYGMNAKSVSINLRDDNTRSFYAWSQYWNNAWTNNLGNGSKSVALSTAGQDVQLSNGPLTSGSTYMYTSAFYPFSQPYYFQNTAAIGTSLQKTSGDNMNYGRGVVLAKEDFQFSYSLKSLTVNNNSIKFVDIPEKKADTSSVLKRRMNKSIYNWNLDSLNTVLLSEPFSLSSSSDIKLVEEAGLTGASASSDISASAKIFGKEGYISYKLELLDYTTNRVISTVKEVRYTPENISECKLMNNSLKTNNRINSTVRIKVTISTNIDSLEKALVNEYGTLDESTLAKSSIQELTLEGLEAVKEYGLSQNYPNPFNPTTTINYQLPKDGHVTLKIYDILGKEVRTLVNEYKSQGRYSVEFNASNLASGTYIYEIRVNDYSSFKKLMLLK